MTASESASRAHSDFHATIAHGLGLPTTLQESADLSGAVDRQRLPPSQCPLMHCSAALLRTLESASPSAQIDDPRHDPMTVAMATITQTPIPRRPSSCDAPPLCLPC